MNPDLQQQNHNSNNKSKNNNSIKYNNTMKLQRSNNYINDKKHLKQTK